MAAVDAWHPYGGENPVGYVLRREIDENPGQDDWSKAYRSQYGAALGAWSRLGSGTGLQEDAETVRLALVLAWNRIAQARSNACDVRRSEIRRAQSALLEACGLSGRTLATGEADRHLR